MRKFAMSAVLAVFLVMIGMQVPGETAPKNGDLMGGWSAAESPKITKHVAKVFDKAFEGFVGAEHKPIAYLGYQVVAGKNHCILCQSKAVVPDARAYYTLVYIYEDLSGNAKITNITSLDIAELSHRPEAMEEK